MDKNLRSALAVLCLHEGMGRTEVRLARAPFPSYTFPSHATMFTGLWPNLHGIAGNAYVKRDGSFQWKPRNWEALPDGPALQGYCTGSDDILAGIDTGGTASRSATPTTVRTAIAGWCRICRRS